MRRNYLMQLLWCIMVVAFLIWSAIDSTNASTRWRICSMSSCRVAIMHKRECISCICLSFYYIVLLSFFLHHISQLNNLCVCVRFCCDVTFISQRQFFDAARTLVRFTFRTESSVALKPTFFTNTMGHKSMLFQAFSWYKWIFDARKFTTHTASGWW